MFGQIVFVVTGLVVTAVAIAVGVMLGVRARAPLAVDVLRRFSRLFNPMQMRSAGSEGAYASIVRHRGRKSGREYATPVGAVAADDGFLIALPYGLQANWVRNVLASGSATIVNEGREHAVDRPELIPLETVASRFSESDQRGFRMFKVDQCLRVRRVEPAGAR